MTLLRDQGSTPLRELDAACTRIETLTAGTLTGDAIARELADIRACAHELEEAANIAHGLRKL